MKRILFILLFCTTAVRAGQVSLTSGNLPYSAQTNDTISISGTHISSATNGIDINNNKYNVVLNLGHDTLEFGTNKGSDAYGIKIQNTNGVKIYGGTILRNQGGGVDAGNHNYALYILSNNYGILIDSTTLISDGHNGKCVYIPGGYSLTRSIDFRHCTFTNNSESYDSRESYGGAAFYAGSMPYDVDDDSFHIRICSSRVTIAPHAAIVAMAQYQIFNCTLTTDAQNVYWDTTYLDKKITAPVGKSADNCYAILCRQADGSQIHDNLIISGKTHQGSRGILIENTAGTADHPVRVYNNELHLNSGPTGENLDGVLRGIRIRAIDGDITEYVQVRNNTIYATVDTSSLTTAYGEEGCAIEWYDNINTCRHIAVDSNIAYARSMDLGTNVKAFEIGTSTSAAPDSANASCSYNQFYSSDYIVRFADEFNGMGTRNFTMTNNILGYLDTAGANDSFVVNKKATWKIGYNGVTSTGNVSLNATYANDAVESDITEISGDIAHQRTLNIHIKGGNGVGVAAAACSTWNHYGYLIFAGTTNNSGNISGIVTYDFYAYSTADSTAYNTFVIRAQSGTEKAYDSTKTVAYTALGGVDTLTISGVMGYGDPANWSFKRKRI